MRNFFIFLGIFLGLFLIGVIGKMVFFGKTVVHNTIKTPTQINNRVMNGDNAIYNYEWFKQQEADIERLYLQEKNHIEAFDRFMKGLPENKADWSYFDKEEYGRLSATVTAQKDMLNRAIQNYNAKSSMVTKNIFKDNLPSNLSRSWFAQKNLLFQ